MGKHGLFVLTLSFFFFETIQQLNYVLQVPEKQIFEEIHIFLNCLHARFGLEETCGSLFISILRLHF